MVSTSFESQQNGQSSLKLSVSVSYCVFVKLNMLAFRQ